MPWKRPQGRGGALAYDQAGALEDAGASSSADAPAPPAAEEQPVIAKPVVVGPSESGYVFVDGRLAMRILRGNPKGSCSVKCYRHSSCTFLLTLKDAPPDAELIDWFFEVPAAEPGANADTPKALARKHVGLADRWRSKKKAKGGAASSSSTAPVP